MRDHARHFLQGNRLRKQSGRSREDGHTFLGFECLMRFFLAQKDMIRVARVPSNLGNCRSAGSRSRP